ncbi:hypothetical protein [Tepidibacillus marianensis]|uniref:hypothetical protein n=1 Tax=Tepidibacillus marianensis TaxID=3131995 RepID=UPI0030D48F9B
MIITGGNLVANMDFRPVFEFHKYSGADITVIYKNIHPKDAEYCSYKKIEVEDNGRIVSIENGNDEVLSHQGSLDIYIISKQKLLDLIQSNIKKNVMIFFGIV